MAADTIRSRDFPGIISRIAVQDFEFLLLAPTRDFSHTLLSALAMNGTDGAL